MVDRVANRRLDCLGRLGFGRSKLCLGHPQAGRLHVAAVERGQGTADSRVAVAAHLGDQLDD